MPASRVYHRIIGGGGGGCNPCPVPLSLDYFLELAVERNIWFTIGFELNSNVRVGGGGGDEEGE